MITFIARDHPLVGDLRVVCALYIFISYASVLKRRGFDSRPQILSLTLLRN